MRIAGFFSLVAILSSGCAALPPLAQGPPSYAIAASPTGTLDQLLAPGLEAHPGETGVATLDTGRESLSARLALCDVAERSIDVQTFDWAGDTVGRVIWDHLRRAADRGVRVRILVDDMHLGGRRFEALAHPNVELRIVNPFAQRMSGRILELMHRLGSLNHRMHNKLFIVDNQVAFVGGRNLADEYFGVHREFNYRDLDVMVIGPAVGEAERAFDDYWNSPVSYPSTSLSHVGPKRLARMVTALEASIARATRDYPYRPPAGREQILARLEALSSKMSWGPARVVWDDPARLLGKGRLPQGGPSQAADLLLHDAQREVVAEAAYFVPDPSLMLIEPVLRRGVQLRILTNSLPSTDLVPVYAHYATSRLPLLALGAKLYEVRPDADSRRRHVANQGRSGRLGLHAKVTVFDRRTVMIGSFNLDPRSRHLNTEVVLIAEIPALAEQILALIEPDLRPENSWSVTIGDRGGLLWTDLEDGRVHRSGFQPGGPWRQVQEFLMFLLPIRSLM